MIKKSLLFIGFAISFVFLSCSKDSGSDCVETLCTEGESICFDDGVHVGKCINGGKGYEITMCKSGFHCENGECVSNVCNPGEGICKDETTAKVCNSTGEGYMPEEKCEPDKDGHETSCVYGKCLMKNCFAGDKVCGSTFLLECSTKGEGWQKIDCNEGEYCDPETLECKNSVCDPKSRVCTGKTTYKVCNDLGSGYLKEESCPDGKECYKGFCFEKVCGGMAMGKDAFGGDVNLEITQDVVDENFDFAETFEETGKKDTKKEAAPIEPLDKGSVVVNGEKWDFTMSLSASYVAEDQRLQISMNTEKNGLLYQLEIHITPIEEFIVGHWTSDEEGDVSVEIRMNDGTGEPGDPSSWKYTATEYDVTIEEFGPVGGRIKGKFSGVLANKDGGPSLTLTDGVFDIKRKN